MQRRVASFVLLASLAGGLAAAAPALSAQQAAPLPRRDSSALVDQMEKLQRDFEYFRQSRIPVEQQRSGGGCDESIGRICIWFGGDEEADFPAEPREVEAGRRQLIADLAEANARIADPWVVGQLVHYQSEEGRLADAEQTARDCRLGGEDAWWCSALLGYALHLQERWTESEAAFRDALAAMDEDTREDWTVHRYTYEGEARDILDDAKGAEQARLFDLYWRLSDPLFLIDGNDRLTDHFARWVEARNYEKAENPQGIFWEEDLEEVLVRYGRIMGWSRTQNPSQTLRMGGGPLGGGGGLQDTRRVVGHHHPRSRGYLFPGDFLESPADVPPESWITAPREARTWYAPPYAPDFNALETQVGSFWRGDEIFVVGAYRPGPLVGDGAPALRSPWDDGPEGPVEAGLFLIPVEGAGDAVQVRGTHADSVFTMRAPPGRWVASLEVLEPAAFRAWRARQGVRQPAPPPGRVAVSDLMILEPGAPYPETLDEAIPTMRRGVRVRRDEQFTVVWEVYGLGVTTPAQVTIGFTEGRPGFLQRVGEFLRVTDPVEPVEITFADANPEAVQTAFRAMTMTLPQLEPGEYTIHLRVQVPGQDPVLSSRPIVVQ